LCIGVINRTDLPRDSRSRGCATRQAPGLRQHQDVGVFIAAPLWFGFDVDAGLIVNALAALGALAAAVAAVWIATTDRRERAKERDAEDEAQAKLVIVTPRHPNNPLELQILVTNHGTRAIIDITFVGLAVEGHDHLNDLEPTTGPFPVIAPPVASTQFAGPSPDRRYSLSTQRVTARRIPTSSR
jgi:hypothetical protein